MAMHSCQYNLAFHGYFRLWWKTVIEHCVKKSASLLSSIKFADPVLPFRHWNLIIILQSGIMYVCIFLNNNAMRREATEWFFFSCDEGKRDFQL